MRRAYGRFKRRYRSRTNPYKQTSYNRTGVRYYAPRKDNVTAQRQLTVMRNPFSTATNSPKIPDGRCSLSTGQRFQAMQSFTCDNSGDGIINFILYGGLGGGLYVYMPGKTAPPKDDVLLFPGNHGLWKLSNINNPITSATFSQAQSDPITQWRLVSQGLKLTLTNNADENDGFFESVRLSATRANEHWRWMNKSGALTTTDLVSGPAADGETGTLVPRVDGTTHQVFGVDLANLVDHPTYQTGKLRDIHKFAFNNKPESNAHEFKRVRLTHEYPVLNDFLDLAEARGLPYNAEAARVVEECIDDTTDIVIVRVHGRSGSTTGGNTKLLAHYVANQEVCYENGSTLSRFHTTSVKMPSGYTAIM